MDLKIEKIIGGKSTVSTILLIWKKLYSNFEIVAFINQPKVDFYKK